MRRKILILAMLFATAVIALPTDASAQRRQRSYDRSYETSQYWQGNHSRQRRWRNRHRSYYGYRNYGQYRRTQVGNRRFRNRDWNNNNQYDSNTRYRRTWRSRNY